MKLIKYISLWAGMVLMASSCEKQIVTFDAEPVTSDMAEYQLHYFVPVINNTAATNIYKVVVNDKVVTTNTATLVTYNAVPSGGVGRFYTVDAGTINIKLYRLTDPTKAYSDDNLTKVYDRNTVLQGGKKQNIFVYDFDEDPIVFDNGYPYTSDRRSYDTDTIGYIKFYNFMYESAGVPTTLKLQYQYQYVLHPLYTLGDQAKGLIPDGKNVGDATGETTRSAWLNIGAPLAFGETTGWQVIPVKKTAKLGSTAAGYFRIVVSAENGGIPGVNVMDNVDWILRRRSSGTNINTYTAWSYSPTLTIGRRIHHIMGGQRAGLTVSDQIATLGVFTAL